MPVLKFATLENLAEFKKKDDEIYARKTELEGAGKIATADTPGLVKPGNLLSVDGTGKLDVSDTVLTEDEAAEKYASKQDMVKVYKPAGSVTAEDLLSLNVEANLGNVYDITTELETNENFVEGAGKHYGIGANVAIVERGGEYKFDVFPGIVDLSNYATKEDAAKVATSDTPGVVKPDGDTTTVDPDGTLHATQPDLSEYAKTADVLSKTEAAETYLKASDVIAITNEEIDALFQE